MAGAGILGVRNWRQSRGITLETIAADTKLSKRHLEAIENGDFSRLPGGIYNTNYIKQYAQAIGFSEAELLAFYDESCLPPAQPVQSEKRAPARYAKSLFQH